MMMTAHSEKELEDLLAAVHINAIIKEMIIKEVVLVDTKGRVEVIPKTLLPALVNGLRSHLASIEDALLEQADGH